MSEAELIFTALAELSTRQIAETEKAKGLQQNAVAGKKGGKIVQRCQVGFGTKDWKESSNWRELSAIIKAKQKNKIAISLPMKSVKSINL